MRQRSNLIILFGIAFFLIGGAIVFLVVNDDDGGSSSSSPAQSEVTVFVASQDIPANTPGSDVIQQGLLVTEQVRAGSQPVGAITSAAALDNQIFAVPVAEGEVVTTAQLTIRSLSNITVPEGFDGVAISVPYTNGGAGYIAPGDVVNIYGMYGPDVEDGGIGIEAAAAASGQPSGVPRSELILTNVLVLDVSTQQATSLSGSDSSQSSVNRPTAGGQLTFLLAMRIPDIERLIQTAEYADLYLSLPADEAPPSGDTPGSDGSSVVGPVSANSAKPQG